MAEGDAKATTLAGKSKKMAKSAVGCMGGACTGFRDFILRGNVVDMAIGIVIGGAFTSLVNAFVSDFITPLIAAIWGGADFSALAFYVNGSKFSYGHFINVLITFLLVCVIIYFVIVMPMNALVKHVYTKVTQRPDGCPFCGNEEVPYTATKCSMCCSELPPLPADVLKECEEKEAERLEDLGDATPEDEEVKGPDMMYAQQAMMAQQAGGGNAAAAAVAAA